MLSCTRQVTFGSTVIEPLTAYVEEVLGIQLRPKKLEFKGKLHYYLQDAFDLYDVRVLERPMLLALQKARHEATLARIKHLLSRVADVLDKPVIYVPRRLASFERRWLIEQKVPFIVPGNQLYLPDVGIDLREHFRKGVPQESARVLSPATQAVLINALMSKRGVEPWRPTEPGAALGYTAMTLSRAVRELTASGIATLEVKGKEHWLRMSHPPAETWEVAKPRLRSPVKQTLWIRPTAKWSGKGAPLAGHSALARYTKLADPEWRVHALTPPDWQEVAKKADQIPGPIPEAMQLQIWQYAPALRTSAKVVDPLSLTLSLQDDQDERVQLALEELKEEFPW
jgi:hypothetical protein